jgi:hypothetical protein
MVLPAFIFVLWQLLFFSWRFPSSTFQRNYAVPPTKSMAVRQPLPPCMLLGQHRLFLLQAMMPLKRIFHYNTGAPAAPLQVVSSPVVMQLAVIRGLVDDVELEQEDRVRWRFLFAV